MEIVRKSPLEGGKSFRGAFGRKVGPVGRQGRSEADVGRLLDALGALLAAIGTVLGLLGPLLSSLGALPGVMLPPPKNYSDLYIFKGLFFRGSGGWNPPPPPATAMGQGWGWGFA